MSVEAHPSALTTRWAGLPVDGVVRVIGADRAAMAVLLDSPAAGAPTVIGCDVDPSHRASRIVDDVIGQLSTAARELLPAWLPGGEHADGATSLDRRVVRTLARSLAAATSHYGPFLEVFADDALTGGSACLAFPAETRARGVARILAAAYGRATPVVVMLVSRKPMRDAGDVSAAATWLADHGGFGVWLVGADLARADRFVAASAELPDHVVRRPTPVSPEPSHPDYPAVAGLPHPRSEAEQRLDTLLASLAWARGRVWNQLHRAHPLAPPIRVDLMWPHLRCAVEIDGPDHRGALKYADDRRRDNTLVLDGYAVLRFTNDEILDDSARVLSVIERLITSRQKGDMQ